MGKIVASDSMFLDQSSLHVLEDMCRAEGHEFISLHCRDGRELVARANDAEVLLVCTLPIDGELLDQLPSCRLVVRMGVGYDCLSIPDLTARGILACHVPDYGAEDVAVHALALLLAAERQIVQSANRVRAGIWDASRGYPMRRLSQKTLGLLGLGRIGRRFAHIVAPLGYRMIGHDPYASEETFHSLKIEQVGLDDLFRQADVLALFLPSTRETVHVVNRERLALVRKGFCLVNTSRGNLVDSEALLEAMNGGLVAAAAVDVLEEEPLDPGSPLLSAENLIVTPHMAFLSVESGQALNRLSGQTAIDFLAGKQPAHILNPEVWPQVATGQPT